ncbi:MAG: hypothetical protein WC117_00095 [Sphaerochaetaceae bacterium]|jgi:Holliday junction resolvasome RuvABC endonuclease subunit
MKIPVAGFDPSLTHWGFAEGNLDLVTGVLDDLTLSIAITEKGKAKQIRTNSDDLQRAEDLATKAFEVAKRCKVIFVECPVGSQSANGMKSYGIVIGILGSLRAQGIQIIEVTASEVKKSLSGNKKATKREMIDSAYGFYPEANWLKEKSGRLINDNEHTADAVGAIHAGVTTPLFQNLMRLYAKD